MSRGVFSFAAMGLLLFSLRTFGAEEQERVHLIYWDKWHGFEGDNLQAVIDDFNRSQTRIWVDYTPVSNVDQKTLVAVAGGNPPDIAGMWDLDVVPFAEKNALLPLDDFLRGTNLNEKHYIPAYWKLCQYQGHVWALISTPTTLGLYYNKRLFKKAGLDPARPPRTLAELDAYSRKLTKFDARTGRMLQSGFLPTEPGWWSWCWGPFFGGRWWDGTEITATDPRNLEAYSWIQRYSQSYGLSVLQVFSSGFGNNDSPENAFFSGRVAMELQGVWYPTYIKHFAPDLDWGVAPFPSQRLGEDPPTIAAADMVMIPRGCRHPREAFEFIAYLNQQGPMEKLCAADGKNTALRQVSEAFYRRNGNPQIRLFQKLAWSKNAVSYPRLVVWNEYGSEIGNAFEKIWTQQASPAQALGEVQARMQASWQRELKKGPVSPFLNWLPALLSVLVGLGLVATIAALEWREQRYALASGARRIRGRLWAGLGFAAPGLIGFFIFTIYPLISAFLYSFCDYSVLQAPRWIGFGNFLELAHDAVFWNSLKVTLLYSLFSLPINLFASIFCALLLDSNVRGVNTYRTLFFLPFVTPLVANAIVWKWIFNNQGVLNYLLGLLSLGKIQYIPWLTDGRFALCSLVIMGLWSIGQTIVIQLAAFQEVPVSLYEAAELDGAGIWQKIWHIALPSTSPVIYFNLVMGLLGCAQVFAVPYIMTGGGPARSTQFYTMYLWDNAFQYLRMGYASAMAWILFIIILLLTLVVTGLSRSKVHYTGGL